MGQVRRSEVSHPDPLPEGAGAFPYRMKDLCARTGLSRQVLHFYIQQGLLPEGRKTGRTMAWYGEAHLARIRLIRTLQEERFLPLKAIRAMLEERDDAFSPAQRRLISEVRAHVGPELRAGAGVLVPAAVLLKAHGVTRAELQRLEALGFLATRRDARGRTVLAGEDAYVVELWGALKQAGFDARRGFRVEDLALYEQAVSALVQAEARLLAARLAGSAPGTAAEMIGRALPLIHTLLTRYHTRQVRSFLATH